MDTPADQSSQTTTTTTNPPKKKVCFSQVDLYQFERTQGFVSIPSDEADKLITLGMSYKHTDRRTYSLDDYLVYKRKLHLQTLEKQMQEINEQSDAKCDQDGGDLAEDLDDEDEEGPIKKEDIAVIVQNKAKFGDISVDLPISTDIFCPILDAVERRQKLKECAGVQEHDLDLSEAREIDLIRVSRQICGCTCTKRGIQCLSETCSCFANGIGCQQDKYRYPCACAIKWCRNPEGVKRFDDSGVRKHWKEVIAAELKSSDSGLGQEEATAAPLTTNVKAAKRKSSPRRKYTAKRKKKAAATVLVTPVVTQYAVSPATETTEPAPKRRGRRKKSETTPMPVAVVVEMKPPLLSPSSSQSSSSSTALSQEALPVNLIDQL